MEGNMPKSTGDPAIFAYIVKSRIELTDGVLAG